MFYRGFVCVSVAAALFAVGLGQVGCDSGGDKKDKKDEVQNPGGQNGSTEKKDLGSTAKNGEKGTVVGRVVGGITGDVAGGPGDGAGTGSGNGGGAGAANPTPCPTNNPSNPDPNPNPVPTIGQPGGSNPPANNGQVWNGSCVFSATALCLEYIAVDALNAQSDCNDNQGKYFDNEKCPVNNLSNNLRVLGTCSNQQTKNGVLWYLYGNGEATDQERTAQFKANCAQNGNVWAPWTRR